MVALAWAALMLATALPYWPVNPALSRSPWFTFQIDLIRALWAVLPGAILWGASFPLALAGVGRREQDPGRLVGTRLRREHRRRDLRRDGRSRCRDRLVGTQHAQRILIVIAAISAALHARSRFASDTGKHAASAAQRGARAASRSSLLARWLAWSVAPIPRTARCVRPLHGDLAGSAARVSCSSARA